MIGRIVLIAIALAAGWIGGSYYPAPQSLMAQVTPQFIKDRADTLKEKALAAAQDAGQVLKVEHVDTTEAAAAAADEGGTPAAAMPTQGTFVTSLSQCPGMTVTNGPKVDRALKVVDFKPVVDINGAAIATDPVVGACLSSGFGTRDGRLHKGLDYHEDMGGPIMAGGDGTIIEMKYRDDYGNMLLIDHGHGVYTRYAHLAHFAPGLKEGAKVEAGEVIGLMGNTAAYPVPIHLHYEVLTGDYNNPKASFGLTPVSPLTYPAAKS